MHNLSSGVRPSKVRPPPGAETQPDVDRDDLQWPFAKQNTDFSWDRPVHGLLGGSFSTDYIKEINESEWRCAGISMILSRSSEKFHHFLLQTAWTSQDFPRCDWSRALDELMSHVFKYICVFECCFPAERSFVIVVLFVVETWNKKIRQKLRRHGYYFKSSLSWNVGRARGRNNNHSKLSEIDIKMHKWFGQIPGMMNSDWSNCGIYLKIRSQRSRPGPEQMWIPLKWNCNK